MYHQNWEEMDQLGRESSRKRRRRNDCSSSSYTEPTVGCIVAVNKRERIRGERRSFHRVSSWNSLFLVVWLMLSVGSSLAVMAYQNDLSAISSSSEARVVGSANGRHGCIWSRTESLPTAATTATSLNYMNGMYGRGGNNPFHHQQQQHSFPVLSSSSSVYPYYSAGQSSAFSGNGGGGSGVLTLNCNVRTLNPSDLQNYTADFTREQVEQSRVARVECSDKLFFESGLSPNQTLFQLRNLRQVEIKSCKIRKVPKAVFSSFKQLKQLVIQTDNQQWGPSVGLELESGAFLGLEQLESLDLSWNNMWNLFPEPNVLCPMRNLVSLNVSGNRLSDIDEFGLVGGGDAGSVGDAAPSPFYSGGSKDNDNYCALNIQNLDLSSNSLRRLGRAGFSRLRRLAKLRLDNNLLNELTDTSFSGLSQLKLLNLSSNRLVALPPSIFNTSPAMRELYLQNNSISALAPHVFTGLDQLLVLDVSRNSLTSQWVRDSIFSGLIRLVVLKLSYNQLTSIDPMFSELISLQALYLDNNEISSISPSAFQLPNLHILNLSNNRLQFVDGRLLSNLFVLRQLYLDHNQIHEMDSNSLKNCSSLEDLGLSNNHLQEVPVALRAGLAHLKTLDIGENRITSVSNETFDLPQVYGLRMVENRITELPAGFCSSMKNLRVLNIAQNKINKIFPRAFSGCSQVRALRLDGNSLTELPTSQLAPLGQLLWLNVSENNLRSAHLDYQLLRKIEWLDLSHNEIESLQQSFKQNSSIRVLDVSYNNLELLDNRHIPPTLETLRVNHNRKLTKINPDTFVLATQLRRVELTGNQIENLPLSALRVAGGSGSSRGLDKPLPEFYIGGNPFVCDCSMEWLTRVNQLAILRQYPNFVDLQAITCRPTSPRSTSNSVVVPLLEAQSKDFFLCPYTSHCFQTCHCCEFDACDCEMTCPSVNETHSCECVHNTAWSSNIVDCSNLEFAEIPPIPIDSTEVYLDGNVIPTLKSFAFLGRKNLQALYLNGSQVQVIRNNTFSSLKLLTVLHLEDNLLPELKGYEFKHLQNLKELYLQNNRISYIHKDTFSTPTFSLQVLRLDGNRLVDFNIWDLKLSASRVMLANPFTCDCRFITNLRKWAASLTNTIIVDYSFAKCYTEEIVENLKQDGNNSSAILISSGQPISSECSQSFNYNPDNPGLLPSASSAPNGGGNHVGLMNNHISSGGGAGHSTGNIGSSSSDRYHHAHLEKQAGNYHQGFPQNENIAATAAAGGGGLRRSSKTDRDDDYNESSGNSTFFTCLVTFIAIIVVAAIAFLVALVAFRKRRVSQDSTSWLWCCDINGSSSKCLSVSPPNEARLGLGSNSDTDFSDKEKLFDAYFLYSQSDEEFVTEKLIGELERGPVIMHPQQQHYYPRGTLPGQKKLRVCLHFRDLCLAPDNPWSSEMILSAMSSSRTVVLVVSNNFLNTEWSNNHFRTSVVTAAQQHCKKLVVIRLPPVNDQIFTFPVPPTKLDWGDVNFWPKFRQLLPPASYSTLLPAGDSTASDINSQLAYTTNFNHNGINNFLNSAANNNASVPYQLPIIPSHHYHQPSDPVSTIAPTHHQQHPHFLTMMNWTGQGIPTNHSSSIHPVPSQLTPQQFGYSNIDGFQNCSQQTLFSPHHQQQQPLHFSSSNNNSRQSHRQQHSTRAPHHNSHCHPANHHNNPTGHGQQHIHSLSQLSNMSSSKSPVEGNYSSSAISSGNEEFDHVYSTLDSPLESPCSDLGPGHVSGHFDGAVISGAQVNRHQIQHSTSSGISSASDATSGTGGCHPGGGSGPPMYFV